VSQRHRLHDRRSSRRPVNGDTAPCPSCKTGIVEFNERYRLSLATADVTAAPAWVCDACPYRALARVDQQPAGIRAGARNLPVEARRQLLPSRFGRPGAGRALSKSVAGKKVR
jgi:hypothetical protein